MKTTISRSVLQAAMVALAAASGAAQAQYYGGLMLDPARLSGAANLSGLPEHRFHVANPALEDSRIRYGLKLGYPLNSRWGLVANYSQFDRGYDSAMLVPDSRALRSPSRSTGLDVVGTMPFLERFSLTGSAGVARLRGDAIFAGGARPFSAARLGLGVQYEVNRSLGLRLDMARYRSFGSSAPFESDADNFSFGVMLKF